MCVPHLRQVSSGFISQRFVRPCKETIGAIRPSASTGIGAMQRGENPAEKLLAPHRAAVASLAARADSEGIDARRIPEDLCRVACSVVQVAGEMWCMFLNKVQGLIQSGEWEGILIGTKRKYDETPHKVRTKKMSEHKPKAVETKGMTSKILQTEFTVFAILRRLADDKFIQIIGRVPTWLQSVETCSGPTILAAQQAIEGIVFNLRQVASCFNFQLSMPVTDRHPSNIWAEKQMIVDSDWKVWRNFCTVHKASTATKASLSLVEGHISGVLSVGLCQQFGGSTAKLREILAEIIAEKLIVRHGPPTSQEHRHLVYSLFLDTGVCAKRSQKVQSHLKRKQKYILQRLINGDIQEDGVVTHWCMPLRSHEEVLSEMISFAVPASVPHACGTINRGSFLGHEAPIGWCGLLAAHHNLLKPLICQYCNFRETVPKPIQSSSDNIPTQRSTWALCISARAAFTSSKDPSMVDNELQICEFNAGGDIQQGQGEQTDGDISWQELNRATRRKAALYAAASPGPVLILLSLLLKPFQRLIISYIYLSSKQWDADKALGRVQQQESSYRGLELFMGKQTQIFFAQVSDLLMSAHEHLHGLAMAMSHKVLMFRFLSKGSSCVASLLRDPHKSCPFALFNIVLGLCDDLLAIPNCMRDEVTKWFLTEFKDVHALRSKRCQNMICGIGRLMDVDILKIEARHSSSRRLVQLKSCQTWALAFDQLSAEWTVRQQVCEDDQFRVPVEDQDDGDHDKAQPERRQRKKGRKVNKGRGGHGGPWRVFLHFKYANRRNKGWHSKHRIDFKKSSKEFQKIKRANGPEWRMLQDIGQLTTLAGKRKIRTLKNLGFARAMGSQGGSLNQSIELPGKSETALVATGSGLGNELALALQQWKKQSATSANDSAQQQSLVLRSMHASGAEIMSDLGDSLDVNSTFGVQSQFLGTGGGEQEPDCVNVNVPVSTFVKARVGLRFQYPNRFQDWFLVELVPIQHNMCGVILGSKSLFK